MPAAVKNLEPMYKNEALSDYMIRCPVHGLHKWIKVYNKQKRPVGLKCKQCYKHLPIIPEK